jgi:hypothetical protein
MRSSFDKFVSTLRKAKDEGRWVFVMSRFGSEAAEVHTFVGVVADTSDELIVISGELAELRFPLDRDGFFEYTEFRDLPDTLEANHMKQTVNLDAAVIMRSQKKKAYVQVGIGKSNTKPVF